MNEIYLTPPNPFHEELVLDYRSECLASGEKQINGSCGLHHFKKYKDWMANVERNRNMPITPNTTRADSYLAFRAEDDRLVGTIQLRHSIPKPLEICGGHIGYEIRPSERRKGYGKAMLKEVLKIARQLGMKRVRIDCDKENAASRNTILACGGVFDKELLYTCVDHKETVQHFIISP